MDYDDDGILDFISGSYDPGDVYLFRGLGDGEYAKVETILDEDDQPLVHHPVEFAEYARLKSEVGPGSDSDEATSARVASFGSWPAAVDWDDDGDLDMLIGDFGGGIYLRKNIGSRSEPIFDRESVRVKASGKSLKENSHANPVVADWDGDGKWDLVVGSGDGSVAWYQNIGTSSEPEFGSRNQLLEPAADSIFLRQNLKADESPVRGTRAQICVTDYNGDGAPDLLVGDHSEINWTRELTEEERLKFAQLGQQQAEVVQEMSALQEALFDDDSPDADKQSTEEEYQKVVQKYQELEKEKKSYFADSRSASFLWLYLRNASDKPQTYVSAAAESADEDVESGPVDDEPQSNGGPVSIELRLDPIKDSAKQRLSIDFEIDPKWHIYATEKDNADSFFPTSIELVLPEGIEADGDWRKPAGDIYLKNPGVRVYSGSVTFARDLKITGDQESRELSAVIAYQVCNEDFCLPPKTIRKSLPVPNQED